MSNEKENMKKRVSEWLVIWIVIIGSFGAGPVGNAGAQRSREVPTPRPPADIGDLVKGPAEGILDLTISDGLKRVLLADLFAAHGEYEQAREIADYTRPVMVMSTELAAEEDPEIRQLLQYLQQNLANMAHQATTPGVQREQQKARADVKIERASKYTRLHQYDMAQQALLEALELYHQLEEIERQMHIQRLEGQQRIRQQLERLYKELGKPEEAEQQARERRTLEHELERARHSEAR